MSNVELLKHAYQNFAEGNIEAVVAIFHPEIEWNNCQGLPHISGDGISIGPNAVVQENLAPIPELYENFHIEVQELFGCGDKVVMVGYHKGVWKATGKEFKANAIHIATVKDGKVTHFFEAADTAEIINP